MHFFSGEDTRIYTTRQAQKLKAEVDKMSDSNIVTCDFQEWATYLVSKYKIDAITVFDDAISQSITEVKVEKYNHFYRSLPGEQEYYQVDGYRIVFKIPYDGDSNLWYLQPSYRILTSFEVYDMDAPNNDECGNVYLAFEFTRKELEDQGEKLQEFVQREFKNTFGSFKTMIGHVNNEINSFNGQLESLAQKCLKERKSKADSLAQISRLLEIPLQQIADAPNTTPIPLKRTVKRPPQTPKQKPLPNEYTITDFDYENINKIIWLTGTTMEKTARSYQKNDEEELRDHLLASLNTHYENATGETFRKTGKTDIHIEFENKAAFVGECKVWHGEKLFNDAIQQLMSYSTWHDKKVSVIVFNKKNSSFQGIVNQIDTWVGKNVKSFKKQHHNMWICDYYLTDKNETVKLTILAFDLYVENSQVVQ